MSNTEIIFLPPNTTAKVQPMDAGIISAFKNRYKKMFWSNAIKLSEKQSNDIYKVDQLTAMRWCSVAWKEITPETICNCFSHTDLVAGENASKANAIDLAIQEELCSCIESTLNISPEEVEENALETLDIHEPTSDLELIKIKTEGKTTQTLLTKFFNKFS